MKFELLGKNNYMNAIETVLNNRGIQDVKSFLNPSLEDVIHYSNLINIDKAADCLIKHIEEGNEIYIQPDSDADGNTSFAILYNYLIKIYGDKLKISWEVHNGKEHGVVLSKVPENVKLVIIPDAGSNQYEEHEELVKKGIDVIVLDHHECEKESEHAIVVNNQLSPSYPNKSISGAGIVYKFIQAMDDKLGIKVAHNYLDLVAVGNIADVMDSRSMETRYLMTKGLQQIKNPLIKELIKAVEFSTKGITNLINIAFYVVPLINATIRMGSKQDKTDMLMAFFEKEQLVYYQRGKKYEPIQANIVRRMKNVKKKQADIRDMGVKLIEDRIQEKKLLDNKFLFVDVTNILDKNLTGLVATQIANKYKRPTYFFRTKDDNTLGGSARGFEKGIVKDLKSIFNETQLFIYAEGHANAFGAEIEIDNIIKANEYINNKFKDIEISSTVFNVDFIVPEKSLTKKLVSDIGDLKDVWGTNVEEPLFAFTNLTVNKDDISFIGQKENTMKFQAKGIDFIKFFTDREETMKLFQGESFELNVVGKCKSEFYQGKKNYSVFIEDFEVVKTKKKTFVF